jgi:hypothetical protein
VRERERFELEIVWLGVEPGAAVVSASDAAQGETFNESTRIPPRLRQKRRFRDAE